MANRYEMDLCSGPIFGKLLRFSIPLMFSGILQLLFNAADIIVVGRFAGETALAAVGSTGSLISLITNLFIGLSVGASAVVSRSFGAKNQRAVDRAVHTSITIAAICGVVVGIFGVVFCGHFLRWMGSPADVISGSTLYVRIYFCGLPASMLYNFGAAILRAVGDTKRPLAYLTIAGVVNVLLNLVFVIVFHLDVAGVALATIASQIISCILVLRCLILNGGSVRLDPRKLKIHRAELGQIVRIGLPAGLQSSLFGISNVLIQSSINSFGKIVMAGSAAAANIEGFVYIAMNSFHHTALNFTAQNVGAGRLDRVRRAGWLCIVLVSAIGILLGGIAYIFAKPLLAIYAPDSPAAIMAGFNRMTYVCLPYFICGIMDALVGIIRGLGHSVLPMIVSLCGACGLRIVWIYTIFAWHSTTSVLYLSYPISWIITSLVHTVCLFFIFRSVKAKMEKNAEAIPAAI